MPDGSTGVVHEDRIGRHAAHPETFLATLQIQAASGVVRGFLSVGNQVMREPQVEAVVQKGLVDYCAKTVPRDGFLLCARATGKKHGIVFVDLRPVRSIC